MASGLLSSDDDDVDELKESEDEKSSSAKFFSGFESTNLYRQYFAGDINVTLNAITLVNTAVFLMWLGSVTGKPF